MKNNRQQSVDIVGSLPLCPPRYEEPWRGEREREGRREEGGGEREKEGEEREGRGRREREEEQRKETDRELTLLQIMTY